MSWHVVFSCFSLLGFRLSPKVTWVTLRCLPSLPELVRGLAFVLVCGCVSLAFFDEEPVLDFSDWSALHVALLVLSVFLALTETQVRSLFGQATELDDYVYLSAMYQWLRLVNYTRLLLVVLAYHYLTPLEAELFELVGVYLLTSSWVGVALIPQACIICVLAFISVLLTSSRFRLRGGFYVACLCVLVGLALVSALILA